MGLSLSKTETKSSCGKWYPVWRWLSQVQKSGPSSPRLWTLAIILLGLVLVQIFFKAVLPWKDWHNHLLLEAEKHHASAHKISTVLLYNSFGFCYNLTLCSKQISHLQVCHHRDRLKDCAGTTSEETCFLWCWGSILSSITFYELLDHSSFILTFIKCEHFY